MAIDRIGVPTNHSTAIDLIYDIMRTSLADTVITLTRDECPGGFLLAWYSYSLVLGNNGWGFELLKRDRIVGSSYNYYLSMHLWQLKVSGHRKAKESKNRTDKRSIYLNPLEPRNHLQDQSHPQGDCNNNPIYCTISGSGCNYGLLSSVVVIARTL